VESDQALATVATRTGESNVARVHSKLVTTTLSPRHLAPVLGLLLECLTHTLDIAGILRSVVPAAYPSGRVEDAVTDVLHRTLFGLHADVNVHPPSGPPPPALELDRAMFELLQGRGENLQPNGSGRPALSALLASGADVFVSRGYYRTHVDDLVAAAGVSRGAFYRYFRNKDQLARMLTASAMRAVGTGLMQIPDVFGHNGSAGTRALRRWLRSYNTAQANEAAMLRVWVDAALQDRSLRCQSAAPLDWGRRRMARYLRPRGFGDVDMEAVVMVALLGVFGARQRPGTEVDAAAHVIERGIIGR
jgi:AcrR family transcriptional regulator